MAAKYILAILAMLFFVMAAVKIGGDRSKPHPQTRTWLLIAVIFAAVSAWLFYKQ